MANEYGLFWNSESGDRTYDADSFSEWLQKFFTTGVFNGDMQVVASGGMGVTVQAGYANINGKVRFFDTATYIPVTAASGSYPRIDTIVVERNDTNREITVEYVMGEYSGNTPQPKALVRTANVYQIMLAQIYVSGDATEITQANITDTRPDTDLCGWVVGTVDEIDVEQMTAQAQAEYNQWIAVQQASFLAWYNEMKDQLDQDAAGHLQNEIDAIDNTLTDILNPTVLNVTLYAASWQSTTDGNIYTINDTAIDPAKDIVLTYSPTIGDTEYEAYQSANIRPWNAVTSGSMKLKAVGGAPTVDLPMIIIIKEAGA